MVSMYWLHGEMGHDGVLVHCLDLPLLLIDEFDDIAQAFSEGEKVQFRDLRCKGKNGAVVENLSRIRHPGQRPPVWRNGSHSSVGWLVLQNGKTVTWCPVGRTIDSR